MTAKKAAGRAGRAAGAKRQAPLAAKKKVAAKSARKAAARKSTSATHKAPVSRKAAPTRKAPVSRKAAPTRKAPVSRKAAATRKAPVARKAPATRKIPIVSPSVLGIYEVHITFNSRWIEAVVEFFRDRLGFEERPVPAGAWGGPGEVAAGGPESFSFLTDLQYLVVSTHEGGSLGFMDWKLSARMAEQQGAPPPPAPSAAGLYFLCRDVERVYRELSDRGVVFDGPPMTTPWGHRIIRTLDPEGRAFVFAERAATPGTAAAATP